LVSSTPVLGQVGFLVTALREAGCEIIEGPPVDAEPTIGMFRQVLERAKAENVEAVLGIGGGSALDVAKLVAALVRGRQKVEEVFGINLLEGRELFLVCMPTTSGTGSEVSPNAILLDEADELKKGVVSPHLVPDAAIVDPLLTISVPANVTAATGLDALTHCIEAYANKFSHPAVDVHAKEGIRLISANLLSAVRNGHDAGARAKVALGSLYGGLCLGPVNTAAVHALAYPLGGQFHVPHGVSNAVLLPHVLRFNLPSAPERYAEVASALGVTSDECREVEAEDFSAEGGVPDFESGETATGVIVKRQSPMVFAEQGLEKISELSRACGVPQRLSELGVPRSAIPGMAKAAMKVTRLLKNNLRELTEQDAVRIYEDSY
jgi:alcohol dehydrogenase class IV